ncbi:MULTISPECIES: ABC transporter substrate-binding protein [Paenibacillus]|uniref:ABC transporter substrate-binding protein n=1 Tax=Paenibacillus TaxID=44249 RepID=UPI0022B8941D|nr:extracellular solute-binding protein [Paenibacillus caseinilyticus]MCZ8519699.1 extracellular solute-binding protein [Paenibacillus caseinilyticus]
MRHYPWPGNRLTAAAALTLLAFLGTACGPAAGDTAAQLPQAAQLERAYQVAATVPQLTIWTYYDISREAEAFRSKHPEVQVNVATFPQKDYVEAYLNGLADSAPPDLLLIGNEDIGEFNAIEGLENLEEPPYAAAAYKEAIPGNLWKLYTSFDRERLISLPVQLPTAATYYRRDLLEDSGLPGDPEALGAYLETPENWLNVARRLKEKDHYIFQWDSEPVEVSAMQGNYVREDLSFARNQPVYQLTLDLAKEVRRAGLALRSSVRTEPGQEALRSGKLAMLYMGRWGVEALEQWAPQTKGLWSMTRLPLNLYGWSGGSSLAIPSRSQSKELAWDFACMTTQLKAPARQSSFMDLTPMDELYRYGLTRVERQTPAPFDRELRGLWTESVTDILENGTDTASGLRFIESQSDSLMERDRERLLHYLGKPPESPDSK